MMLWASLAWMLLTLTMLDNFMYYTPPQFLSNWLDGFQLLECIYIAENTVDPDQLAPKKPADLNLHCFQNRNISGFSSIERKCFFSHVIDWGQNLLIDWAQIQCSLTYIIFMLWAYLL